MSTSIRRPLAEALRDAQDFRALFPAIYYERWEIAGSVRRGKADIGDVEHVVEPINVDAFRIKVNELTFDPDDIFSDDRAPFRKHVYCDGRHRWGDKYRGLNYRGFAHEIFVADAKNFGSVFALKTGPAAYSEMLVTVLKRSGRLQQIDGYVKYTKDGAIYAVPTEEAFFEACKVRWIPPAERTA